jgi:hypothetical protein
MLPTYLRKTTTVVMFTMAYCNSASAQKTRTVDNTPAMSPMSCNIKGKVIGVLKDKTGDPASVCGKYPCYATVRITDVMGCGSSVPLLLNTGDTVRMKFAYTLSPTAKVFPVTKTHLPGLKKGNSFMANVVQKLKRGSGVELVVYDYTVIH